MGIGDERVKGAGESGLHPGGVSGRSGGVKLVCFSAGDSKLCELCKSVSTAHPTKIREGWADTHHQNFPKVRMGVAFSRT